MQTKWLWFGIDTRRRIPTKWKYLYRSCLCSLISISAKWHERSNEWNLFQHQRDENVIHCAIVQRWFITCLLNDDGLVLSSRSTGRETCWRRPLSTTNRWTRAWRFIDVCGASLKYPFHVHVSDPTILFRAVVLPPRNVLYIYLHSAYAHRARIGFCLKLDCRPSTLPSTPTIKQDVKPFIIIQNHGSGRNSIVHCAVQIVCVHNTYYVIKVVLFIIIDRAIYEYLFVPT